ncbi:HpcH/HpaI aldolase family protein [Actinophytocola algeriensis]|uniref:2-keto-3-deoxy-L-rhamnonate aldolase RhmA n=1 Tax=Actinophytocola algeriensis TaxID=1768010 RepID=A0A7W7Q7M3_9PSEU|nr:aldolase/citrate lyase family protein [Actinophytocola algeriensis]MBB4908586.1 2-keto-3-deoxy-L-rhamnonate aldolase RhmA [Actinophytocola algeriensis]MBE1475027.1 2-keto-3-deoxy-L-rhamnonate aldolase RhmA [Actinophytocola algeriensis]
MMFDNPGDLPPIGTWLKIPAPDTAEIAAAAGFDFVVIDLEHTMLNLETAYTLIAITSAHGVTPIVRVPDHRPSTIQRVLDAGAGGVLVPHVDTPEQAAAVARATRFPPRGTRGSGATSRAGRWGRLPRAEYLDFGNAHALCLPQLESESAMRDAEHILAVDGVDGVLIGAADLSMEMGRAATDPQVTDLIDAVLATAAEAGKPCGFALGADPARARELAARGFGFLVLGNDSSMLATAAATLVAGTRGPE